MSRKDYDIIVMGASTGGPRAIEKVLKELPENLGVAVLIVQHMPKGFTKSFSERLNRCCYIDVVEAYDGMNIENDKVYIAPGGYHMEVTTSRKIRLNDEPSVWGVKPAVDKLFISASKVFKSKVISIILTGMGKDGAEGIKAIKSMGGATISQDERSSTIYGMPKAAYETGAIDYVVSLDEITLKIISLLNKL